MKRGNISLKNYLNELNESRDNENEHDCSHIVHSVRL